jgi:hypothetical protein
MNNGKIQELEQRRVETEKLPASEAAAKPARNLRLVLVMLLLLAGAFGVSYYLFGYVLPRIPRELVGTWQVVEGKEKGATLEFGWLGAGVAAKPVQGKKQVRESSVRVRGKRIFMTYKGSIGQEDETDILTIVKLIGDELVIRDQDQATYKLIRIRD